MIDLSRGIYNNKDLHKIAKLRQYATLLRPVILYGTETLYLTDFKNCSKSKEANKENPWSKGKTFLGVYDQDGP